MHITCSLAEYIWELDTLYIILFLALYLEDGYCFVNGNATENTFTFPDESIHPLYTTQVTAIIRLCLIQMGPYSQKQQKLKLIFSY